MTFMEIAEKRMAKQHWKKTSSKSFGARNSKLNTEVSCSTYAAAYYVYNLLRALFLATNEAERGCWEAGTFSSSISILKNSGTSGACDILDLSCSWVEIPWNEVMGNECSESWAAVGEKLFLLDKFTGADKLDCCRSWVLFCVFLVLGMDIKGRGGCAAILNPGLRWE